MFDKISLLFNDFLDQFTFRQRFLLFSFIFIACVPFPFYWFIQGQNLYISEAQTQIKNFDKQHVWNSLLHDVILYQLIIASSKNAQSIHEFNERVLFNISAIKNRERDPIIEEALSKDILDRLENLHIIWDRISNNPKKNSHVYLSQVEKLIEIILSELKQASLGNKHFTINLSHENYVINSSLCELYRLQIYTIKLFILEILNQGSPSRDESEKKIFYTNLFRIKNISQSLSTILKNSYSLQELLKNPLFIEFTGDSESLIFYLNELNSWIKSVEEGTEPDAKIVSNLLVNNRRLSDSLIDIGITKNRQRMRLHTHIRNFCIFIMALGSLNVILFVIFRVLTSHFLELDNHIKDLSKGKFKKCFCSKAGDEFGPVGIAFDKMAHTVQEVVSELQRIGRQLRESVKQISKAIHEENVVFKQDEAKVYEVQTLANQMTETIQKLVATVDELANDTEQNLAAENAKQTLEKMGNKISSLTNRSTRILQLLNELKDRLDKNKHLFLFLSKVSNQASLLFLNSSIEASNILTNKQSFIKISQEMQRFAEKTATSTENIQKTMKNLNQGVERINFDTSRFINELNNSTLRLRKVNEHLGNMAIQALDQNLKFKAVNRIMQRQVQITTEVQHSLNHLVKIANENSRHTQHLDQSLIELNMTAQKLQQVLDLFFHPKQIEKLKLLKKVLKNDK